MNEAALLALVQVARIGLGAWESHQKGELSEEDLERAFAEAADRVSAARSNWQASKDSPAAKARRDPR